MFDECTLPYCKPASLYQHDQIEGDVTTFTDWIQSPKSFSSIDLGHESPAQVSIPVTSTIDAGLESLISSPEHVMQRTFRSSTF